VPPVIATLPARLLRKSRSPRACIWPPFGKDSGSEDPAESIRLDRATYLGLHTETKTQVLGGQGWELGTGRWRTVDYFNDVLVEDGHLVKTLVEDDEQQLADLPEPQAVDEADRGRSRRPAIGLGENFTWYEVQRKLLAR
jgi:hypothetical protein